MVPRYGILSEFIQGEALPLFHLLLIFQSDPVLSRNFRWFGLKPLAIVLNKGFHKRTGGKIGPHGMGLDKGLMAFGGNFRSIPKFIVPIAVLVFDATVQVR